MNSTKYDKQMNSKEVTEMSNKEVIKEQIEKLQAMRSVIENEIYRNDTECSRSLMIQSLCDISKAIQTLITSLGS